MPSLSILSPRASRLHPSNLGLTLSREGSVTRLIRQLKEGDASAIASLVPLVHDELHQLAKGYMHGQPSDHTLQATALVNEVVVRLLKGSFPTCNDRTHFFRIAAKAMRRILIDHARSVGRQKRKPPGERVPLDAILSAYEIQGGDLETLNLALERLRDIDPDAVDIVELRFFLGLTVEETAFALDRPTRSIDRDWAAARAWLRKELRDDA